MSIGFSVNPNLAMVEYRYRQRPRYDWEPDIHFIQFSKLANYCAPRLSEEWGGNFFEHWDLSRTRQGLENFRAWIKWQRGFWVDTRDGLWGPESCHLTLEPETLILRDPHEMYLSVGATTTTIRQAASDLKVSRKSLHRWKIHWIMDCFVIRELLTEIYNR